jgi:membrane-associated PAP2 superfamily phosphatase
VSVWPTAIGAHPLLYYNSCQTFGNAFSGFSLANGQSHWRSSGHCQTFGNAFSGFALPCYLFFL